MYRPTVTEGQAERLRPDSVEAMELLAQYLEYKDAEGLFSTHAQAYALSLLDAKNFNNGEVFADWSYLIEPVIDMLALRDEPFALSQTMFGKWLPRSSNAHLTVVAGVSVEELKQFRAKAEFVVCALLNDDASARTDKYEPEWNGFWQFFNMMQFLPGFAAVSKSGLEKMVYKAIPVGEPDYPALTESAGSVDGSWAQIMEQLVDDAARECAAKLQELSIMPPSVVGYELADTSGAIIAECEMVWEREKIAILLPVQEAFRDILLSEGWKVYTTASDLTAEMFQGGTQQ